MKISRPVNNILVTTLLIFAYAVGTIGIFTSYYTSHHRTYFQAGVRESNDDELQRLFFTDMEYRDLQWFEKETEFTWRDKLYDVSSINKTHDGYVILCKNDSLEELLLTLLNYAQGDEKNRGQAKGSPQPQFLSSIFSIQPAVASCVVAGQTQFLQSSYPTIQPDVSSPPPEFFS